MSDQATLIALVTRRQTLQREGASLFLRPQVLDGQGFALDVSPESESDEDALLIFWWGDGEPSKAARKALTFLAPLALLRHRMDLLADVVPVSWVQGLVDILPPKPKSLVTPHLPNDQAVVWAIAPKPASTTTWYDWRGNRVDVPEAGDFIAAALESAFGAIGADGVYQALPQQLGALHLAPIGPREAILPTDADFAPLVRQVATSDLPPFWWQPDAWPEESPFRALAEQTAETMRLASLGKPANLAVLLAGGLAFYTPVLPPPAHTIVLGAHRVAGEGLTSFPLPTATWGDYWVWIVRLHDPDSPSPSILVAPDGETLGLGSEHTWYLVMLPKFTPQA